MFDAYTWMVVDDGETTLFSMDKWLEGKVLKEIVLELFVLISKRARKHHTVSDTLVARVPMGCRYLGHTQFAGPLKIRPALVEGERRRTHDMAKY
jgi:hypothetical protein